MGHPSIPGLIVVATVVASQFACGETERAPTLSLSVAPLELSGVVDACYSLTVLDESNSPVWSRNNLCASQFGAAGGLSFVGPCDTTDLDQDGLAENTVVLTIDGLYRVGASAEDPDAPPVPLSDFIDPCAAPHSPEGCRQVAICRKNGDTPVAFDLVVMRRANQGFFDVAVALDDIFCSAKVDCEVPARGDEPARPLELVFDPQSGERVPTAVWALSCTDGDGGASAAERTHLYMDRVVLRCGGIDHPIDPSAGPGNLFTALDTPPAPIVQAMVHEGHQTLGSPSGTLDALYWSVSLGLDTAFFAPAQGTAPDCTLITRATASRGPLPLGTTPANTNYPLIDVQVPINLGNTRLCTRHPLDAPPPADGVATAYTGSLADLSGFASTSFDFEGYRAGDAVVTAPVDLGDTTCATRPELCHSNAECQDLAGTPTCVCDPGFVGDGATCDDLDECLSAPCPEPKVCTNTPGTFTCTCPPGTTDDGAGGCLSGIPATMVEVFPGNFTMGTPGQTSPHKEAPHQVTLTRRLFVETTEVTQASYTAITGGNPSSNISGAEAPNRPVERVSWYAALAYCTLRSTAESLPACYTLTGCTGTAAAGTLNCSGVTFAGLDCTGYRLPTEAEWEYFARAGTTTPVPLVGTQTLNDIAWYASTTSTTRPVATMQPNAWGIYDVIGN
ncbi:MAG TPA: SUMF1/EgtB/PvdO family nonheme iron enzyme, partial [Myxococcota bacterium]|nr:SUMF1/EgtB/PvdO family nonheme iron enzyme [Myxococcota bacterium]